MTLMSKLTERRSTIAPELDNAALEGKKHHETLYGSHARSAHNWRRFALLTLLIILWDRIELGWVIDKKRYIPVPIQAHDDGSVTFLGTPDPNWKPTDRMIIEELQATVQTLRGRTTDAQWDKKQWQRLHAHCTDAGRNKMFQAYEELQAVPQKGRIEIAMISINKGSEQTFDLRWEEIRHEPMHSAPPKVLRFRGLFQVLIDVPTQDYAALAKNVKGVWIDGWSIAPEER